MNAPLLAEMDDALGATLAEMHQAVAALTDALERERHALLSADVDALNAAGGTKQKLIQRLEQLDGERVQLLRAMPLGDAHAIVWQQILDGLRTCRDVNQRNGGVVSQRLGHVRQALAILTGRSADGGVYGRSGQLHSQARSQALAEA